jgi:serine/threonine protein kinase
MNEQKDPSIQQTQPSPEFSVQKDEGGKGGAGSDELTIFFSKLHIRPESIKLYRTRLATLGVNDVAALHNQASMSFLQGQVGIKPEHVHRIMRKLYWVDASEVLEDAPYSHRTVQSIPLVSSYLSKENVAILFQVGHGASGRVFKALFVPTLTLIAVKYIEIKGAIEQCIVAQELKSLYEVASCNNIGGDITHEIFKTDATTPAATPGALNARAAHSPYVIGFYGAVSRSSELMLGFRAVLTHYSSLLPTNPSAAIQLPPLPSPPLYSTPPPPTMQFIDRDFGAVCLALEYMNSGNLQTLLQEKKQFSLDDLSVIAFSTLKALSVLHNRRIIHRDVKPSNLLIDVDGRIKLTDFGITKELMEDHQAESFIGTVSFMSPGRVQGHEYSFEADFWSLGITLILILTNKHPYPLSHGMWVLTKAIIESPQPALQPSAHISADVCDFVSLCLNANLEDPTFADQLLQHPFILAAKARGVVSDDVPARLTNPAPYLQTRSETPESRVDRFVEIALSWQLERWAELKDLDSSMSRFSDESIALLASQISVDPQVLQAKFREKYDEVDALCQQSWSLEGLRREMWPIAGEKKLADHICMRASQPTFTVEVEQAPTGAPSDYSQPPQLVIPPDLGMQVRHEYVPAVTAAPAATTASDESKVM